MTRLGPALGGRAETFMGWAGVGDLILTATGDLSRNRKWDASSPRARHSTRSRPNWAMWPKACAAPGRWRPAEASGVEMPITRAVCAVLFEGLAVSDAVSRLLQRDARDE